MFRIMTGSVVTLFGLWLVWVGIYEDTVVIVTGLIFGAIGIAILLNRHEDEIEEINNQEKSTEHHE